MITEAVPVTNYNFAALRAPRPTKIPAGLVTEAPVGSSPVTINSNRKGLKMETQTTQKEAPANFTRRDIHQQVTDTIIHQLEAGTVPWQQPWQGNGNRLLGIPENFTTGKKYRGINILLLWCSSLNHDFVTQEWASFKQWQEQRECIRKGEKGTMIVYYDTIEKDVDGELKEIPFLKASYVFNRCQLASYQPPVKQESNLDRPLFEIIYPVEAFIENTKAIIEHNDSSACYIPSADKISMPFRENFITTETCTATEGYYSTLMHELTHWTGHPQRLNRQKHKKFGDQSYALEELVAEFGAAFLCAEFEMAIADKGDHASYIDHWLKVLKENKHFLFTAASEASKAVGYLRDLQQPA